MKVLVAEPLAPEGVELLRQRHEVDVRVGLSREQLIEALPEYEAPQTRRWQPDTGAAGFFRRLFGRGRP